jgi:hypothetical protein
VICNKFFLNSLEKFPLKLIRVFLRNSEVKGDMQKNLKFVPKIPIISYYGFFTE